MIPIGKNILIKKVEEKLKTSSGLLLSQEDASGFRYHKAQVIKPGTEVEIIKADDLIYYDKAAGHSLFIKDEAYTIIQERDVVVVL